MCYSYTLPQNLGLKTAEFGAFSGQTQTVPYCLTRPNYYDQVFNYLIVERSARL
jgi:hypothetical protein